MPLRSEDVDGGSGKREAEKMNAEERLLQLETEMSRMKTEMNKMKVEMTKMETENKEFATLTVSGRLRGELPAGFLAFVMALPDRPLEHIVRFLPAKQIPSMRTVGHRLNAVIRKASASLPKIPIDGRVLVDIENETMGGGEGTFSWQQGSDWCVKKRTKDMVPLSELLRYWRLDQALFFRRASSSTLLELARPWLCICPQEISFVGSLSAIDAASLKTLLGRVEPFINELRFQDVRHARPVLNDAVLMAAGRLDVLMVLPVKEEEEEAVGEGNNGGAPLPPRRALLDIGDATLDAICRFDRLPVFVGLRACVNVTAIGVRQWCEAKDKCGGSGDDAKQVPRPGSQLALEDCPNATQPIIADKCGDILELANDSGYGAHDQLMKATKSDRCITFGHSMFANHMAVEPALDDIYHDLYDGWSNVDVSDYYP